MCRYLLPSVWSRRKSSFRSNAHAQGFTPLQSRPSHDGVARAFGYKDAASLTPEQNADVAMKYYKQQLNSSGNDTKAAYEKYHYGPNSGTLQPKPTPISSVSSKRSSRIKTKPRLPRDAMPRVIQQISKHQSPRTTS